LLVPKRLWDLVGGERPECDGAQDYDLTLRLDAAGARFRNVPLFLYGWRAHAQSTAQDTSNKSYATTAGIRALTNYVSSKKLDWEITAGYGETLYRGAPRIHGKPAVHAVMLYRDQGPLTLQCAKSLLAQEGVEVLLTVVDNGSVDRGIARSLEELGAEVIRIDEGFNFSRLNNRAVAESKLFQPRLAADCPLLFINNDVALQSDAVYEMCRWIDQPGVGIVGARLHYPNGSIQHGGVELHLHSPCHELVWFHTDAGSPFETAGFSRIIRATAAVTAACALIKKQTFLELDGFDEVLYPIAYSDTNLCSRIRQRGWYCLYTPYAIGTHYEGATRGVDNIEDGERSRWLHGISMAKDCSGQGAPPYRGDVLHQNAGAAIY
jgi:GT2 family glycosyltransferase